MESKMVISEHLVRDVLWVVIAVVCLFTVREIVAWFFKTNSLNHRLTALSTKVDKVIAHLEL